VIVRRGMGLRLGFGVYGNLNGTAKIGRTAVGCRRWQDAIRPLGCIWDKDVTMTVESSTTAMSLSRDTSTSVRRGWLVAPGPRAVAIVVFLAAAYFILPGSQVNADTHLFLTVSVVDRGTLTIDPFSRLTSDIAAWHGHYYTDKAPGLSVLGVPLYALIKLTLLHGQPYMAIPSMDMWVRYLLAVALAAVPTAVTAWLLFWLLARMGVSRGWCAGLALTYGLGTIARPFASLFFSHQLSAMLCFGAFALAFRLRRDHLSTRFAVVVGLLLGYALITEYPSVIAVAAIGAYLVMIPQRGRLLGIAAGLGTLPPLAIGALYNALAFGGPLHVGYGHLAGPLTLRIGQAQGIFGVTHPHLTAIWGTTFSPYRGLFFLSPILLLALPACVLLVRRAGWQAEGLLCAVIATGFLLFNMSYFAWTGGASMGPRQVLISLPFFVLPLGELVRLERSLLLRRMTAILAIYSIALVELCAAVSPTFGEVFISPVTQLVLPRLAGLHVDTNYPDGAHTQLIGALLHQLPGFLGAKFTFNWAQVTDLPGLTQLYPLAVVVALVLLWPTLAEHLLPRMRALADEHAVPRLSGLVARLASLGSIVYGSQLRTSQAPDMTAGTRVYEKTAQVDEGRALPTDGLEPRRVEGRRSPDRDAEASGRGRQPLIT